MAEPVKDHTQVEEVQNAYLIHTVESNEQEIVHCSEDAFKDRCFDDYGGYCDIDQIEKT